MQYREKKLSDKRKKVLMARLESEVHTTPLELMNSWIAELKDDVNEKTPFSLWRFSSRFADQALYNAANRLLKNDLVGWQYLNLHAHMVYYGSRGFHEFLQSGVDFPEEDRYSLFDQFNFYWAYLFLTYADLEHARKELGVVLDFYFTKELESDFHIELRHLCLFLQAIYSHKQEPKKIIDNYDLGVYGEVIKAAHDRVLCYEKLQQACDLHLVLSDETLVFHNKEKVRVHGLSNTVDGLFVPEIHALQKVLRDFFALDIDIDHPLMHTIFAKPPVFNRLLDDEMIRVAREVCDRFDFKVPLLDSETFENSYFDPYFK